MLDSTQLYEDNKRMVSLIASRFARKYPAISHDEFVSESNLVFCRCQDTWQPERSSFSTYLNRRLHWELTRYASNYLRKNQSEINSEIVDQWSIVDGLCSIVDRVSDDASTVVRLVFETPSELAEIARRRGDQPYKHRRCIRLWLQRKCAWSTHRINSAFSELSSL